MPTFADTMSCRCHSHSCVLALSLGTQAAARKALYWRWFTGMPSDCSTAQKIVMLLAVQRKAGEHAAKAVQP